MKNVKASRDYSPNNNTTLSEVNQSLPHNIEAEQAILGAILLDNESLSKIIDILKPEDFYRNSHCLIYKIILELHENGIPIDLIKLKDYLKAKDLINNIGGISYLTELVNVTPTSANIESHADIVHKKSIFRQRNIIANDLSKASLEEDETAIEVIQARWNLLNSRITNNRNHSIFTLSDLQNKEIPELKWVIPGIIPQGLSIIAGRPKSGKSYLALQIGLAVATGGKVFNQDIQKGRVFYLALEDTERRIKKRAGEQMPGEQLPENFHYCVKGWGVLPEAGVKIEAFLREHEDTSLLIVDTLKKIRPPRKHSKGIYDDDYDTCTALMDIANKYNTTLIVNHHTNKSKADDIFDTISGSYGLTGAVDTMAVLKKELRTKGDAVLYLTGRDIEEKELAMRFDPKLKIWCLMGDASEYRLTKEREEVLRTLKEANEPLSSKEISERIGNSYGSVRALLNKMVKENQIYHTLNKKYTTNELQGSI